MTRRNPIPETVLAKAVVDWLGAEGWEVYPEIETYQGGPRADIVATRDETIWVIEVKRSLTFELIGQADRWKSYAHRVSIAVRKPLRPTGAQQHGRFVAERLLKAEGIGFLQIDFAHPEGMEVSKYGRIEPKDREDPPNIQRLRETLTPHHKGFARAGNATGERLTKWGLTMIRVREAVRAAPGHTIKDIVAVIDHHYASDAGAVQGIRSAVRSTLIETGLRIDESGKEHRLYPAEDNGTGQKSQVSAR